MQDHQGFLWFGTQDGLNRFDGYQFKIYRHRSEVPHSLGYNFIKDIHQDERHRIWIATWGGGIDCYDPRTDRFSHFPFKPDQVNGPSHDRCYSICGAGNGVLWIGTENGLDRFDTVGGKWEHFKHEEGIPGSLSNNEILCLCYTKEGVLWVGTAKGLNWYNPADRSFKRFFNVPEDPRSLSDNHIRDIYEDRSGNIWVATKRGLNRYDPAKNEFTRYMHNPQDPGSPIHDHGECIYEDPDNTLWIGTHNGLDVMDRRSNTFSHYQYSPDSSAGLTHNYVIDIYRDRSGVLWVGTWNGLNKFSPAANRFTHYLGGKGPVSMIYAVHETPTGQLWLGSEDGLLHFNPHTSETTRYGHHPDAQGISNNVIYSILEEEGRYLWLSTEGGLGKFDTQTRRYVPLPAGLPPDHLIRRKRIYSIHMDAEKHLWIAAWGEGLFKMNTAAGTLTEYKNDPRNLDSLPDNYIFYINGDHLDNLWLGTSGGLCKLDPQSNVIMRFQHDPLSPDSLSNNKVMTFCFTAGRKLWVGTLGGGLNRYNELRNSFTHFREKQGLANDSIYAILEDRLENLWVSTNKGISRFNPQTGVFTNYDDRDGLQSNEFNILSAHRGPSGRLYFGGINGINGFYPSRIKANTFIPPVVITCFRKFNREVKMEQSITQVSQLTLTHKDYLFSFEFAALDYFSPDRNMYKYMLEGLDDDWITTDAGNRIAAYTNLDPGRYVFKVTGSNGDGLWNRDGVSIALTIVPPFWNTTWFKILALMMGVLLLLALYRYRVNRVHARSRELEAVNKELNRQVAERREAEMKLTKSEHRLRTILENANEGFLEVDTNGNIRDANAKLLEIFGVTMAEVNGRSILRFLSPDDAPGIFRQLRAFDETQKNSGAYTLFRSDGTPLYCLISGSPIYNADGRQDGAFAIVTDLTDIKKTEAQLHQIQKMETIGTLAGGLAHDFNNVLGGITATVSMMEHACDGKEMLPVEEIKADIRLIEESAQRAAQLVNRLMELSRKQKMTLTPLDLNESLRHVIKICSNSFDKGIRISAAYYPEPAMISADAVQVEQVILNLCVNASHAMTIMRGTDEPKGGTLSVRITSKPADAAFKTAHPETDALRYWELSISDTGVGMEPHVLDRIFDPFYTTKEKGLGTGLGLSTVFSIIRRHNGALDVHSEPGSGSVFRLYFPALPDETNQSNQSNQTNQTIQTETGRKDDSNPTTVENSGPLQGAGLVLVVDDEKMILTTARRILTSCGFKVLTAEDGVHALELFKEHYRDIHAVLLDMAMPELSGKDTFLKMKEIDPNVNVLIISGFRDENDIQDICAVGSRGFIKKPFTRETLTQALKNISDNHDA